MSRRTLFAVVFASLLYGGPIQASEYLVETGLDLLHVCKLARPYVERDFDRVGKDGPDAFGKAVFCIGYIRGFVAGHDALGASHGEKYAFCTEKVRSVEQYMRVFSKWADDNPEQLHLVAPLTLFLALREAFPCKKKGQ